MPMVPLLIVLPEIVSVPPKAWIPVESPENTLLEMVPVAFTLTPTVLLCNVSPLIEYEAPPD